MTEIIKNVLPKNTNLEIINLLIKSSNWYIALDAPNATILNKLFDDNIHSGFSMTTFNKNKQEYINENLNLFAFIITDIICDKINIKNYEVDRFMWNYYLKNNEGINHVDQKENNYISILYSLHDGDGGIQIGDNFYQDVMGEAKIFKSNVYHKGIGPKTKNARFNLNIVLKICTN